MKKIFYEIKKQMGNRWKKNTTYLISQATLVEKK
jgi:Fe-S cluster biosynthesis and repair protein YggX